MEPDQGGAHNSREDDDTAMRGGGPPAHTSGAASSSNSSTNSGAPKFTYNLLHYPRYPSYEVLLEKRFKTLPLPTNEAATSEATSVSTVLPLLLPTSHQANEEDGGVDGRTREESTATPRPLNNKRVHSAEEASGEMESESTVEKNARVEDAGDRPTKKMRRTPSRRSKEGKEVEVDIEDKDEGSGVLPMMIEGGSSPLLTTTTSSASLLDLEVSGGSHLALLGANGLEPEDRPAEDDCEAEPTQSVEDEHCGGSGSAMSLERGSVDSTTASGIASSSSSSSAPSASSPSAAASTVGLTATATSASAGVRREGMTRDEMKASAVSLHNLIEPLADLQRNVQEVGVSLRNHRFHYNLDLCKLVTGIDRSVTELNDQILSRRRFLEFVLHLGRPVQTNLGYFGALPIELVLHIFGYLDGKDLLLNADVCSTFAALSNDAHLWKNIVERTWDLEGTYMQKPSHKSFKWLFECKKRVFKAGDMKNGKGSCGGEHGDMYEGEWKDNKRHGVGTGLMQDGRRYDGEWENDMRSGFGIFRWPINYAKNGGDLYAGNWKEDQRHGEGIYIWADGTKYEGQWKEGKREGFGSVVWPDGRRYEGEYKDGKMSGKGTFCWPDGSVYVGEYKDGKRHGEGTYTYSTMMGGVYTGQWRNGMRDGWGKLVKNDGEMYQGVWKFNCPFGGVLTKKDGTVIEKFWRLFPPGT